jgi:hypothetical protein
MADTNNESSTDHRQLEALKDERKTLAKQRTWTQLFSKLVLGFSILIMVFVSALLLLSHQSISRNPTALLSILYAAIAIATMPSLRSRLRDLESELQQINFEIDLFSYDVSKRETRAEKMLRLNDIQLRRYYDLNLSQNSWVFGLGVGCIALGTFIIVVTLYLILHFAKGDTTTQIITAVLGGIGALLTNFVAAIYLKMNASITANLAAFHSRLVETHTLMLGNLLASKIEDDEKRWNTLADLALRLVQVREEKV